MPVPSGKTGSLLECGNAVLVQNWFRFLLHWKVYWMNGWIQWFNKIESCTSILCRLQRSVQGIANWLCSYSFHCNSFNSILYYLYLIWFITNWNINYRRYLNVTFPVLCPRINSLCSRFSNFCNCSYFIFSIAWETAGSLHHIQLQSSVQLRNHLHLLQGYLLNQLELLSQTIRKRLPQGFGVPVRPGGADQTVMVFWVLLNQLRFLYCNIALFHFRTIVDFNSIPTTCQLYSWHK